MVRARLLRRAPPRRRACVARPLTRFLVARRNGVGRSMFGRTEKRWFALVPGGANQAASSATAQTTVSERICV